MLAASCLQIAFESTARVLPLAVANSDELVSFLRATPARQIIAGCPAHTLTMDTSIASVGSDVAEMSLDELRAEVQRARTEVVGRTAASPGPSTIGRPFRDMLRGNQPLTPPPQHVPISRTINAGINPRASTTGRASVPSPQSAQHPLSPPQEQQDHMSAVRDHLQQRDDEIERCHDG